MHKRTITEDELGTFGGYLSYQGISPESEPKELLWWREQFDEKQRLLAASRMMGHLNLGRKPGYHFYGVAIQKNGTLFLTLWIKCDSEGHIYVLYRRPDGEWNPHASYHKDGKYHNKSHGQVSVEKKLQHLNANFRGSETMGLFTGHGTSMGALCEPADYDGVVIVDPSVLGPRHGAVSVDIIQPGFEDAWKSEVAPKFYPDGAHSCTIFKRGNHPSLAITIVQ